MFVPTLEAPMTSPHTPEARLRAAKIIHGALIAGSLMFLLVTTWVQRTTESAGVESLTRTLTYAGLALLGTALVLLRILPSPDPAPAPGQSPDQWWVASQGRLIVLWAVVDGAALFNAVVWFLTRERTPLAAAAGALVVLFALRPGRYLDQS